MLYTIVYKPIIDLLFIVLCCTPRHMAMNKYDAFSYSSRRQMHFKSLIMVFAYTVVSSQFVSTCFHDQLITGLEKSFKIMLFYE